MNGHPRPSRSVAAATRTFFLLMAAASVCALLLGGCGSETLVSDEADESEQQETVAPTIGTIDDVDCDLDSLPADESIEFLVVHYVVDGELGEVCYGEDDDTLYAAWGQLTVITPPGQLTDLFLFAGFSFDSSGDDETVAFVNVADDDGAGFQMSINLDAYDADPDEAALTLAHEFSHVFTSTSAELDRSVGAPEDCDTYFNTEGCFLPDSVMALWIDVFWGDGLIDQIDVYADPDPGDGETRCALDGRFLGPYAASNPEEDFAETFSAFVFQVEPVTDDVQAKFDWLADQPGLAEFRDRSDQAGLGPLDNNFEACGS